PWPLPARPAGRAVAAAAAALRAGGLVAVPTDTVYGVACLAQDSRALAALYRLKGRPESKPLAVCLPDLDHIYRYCKVSVSDTLLQELLPGPVTVVLERSEALNKDLNPFTPLVGVRIPSHWFTRQLARVCAAPLALTSANVSNEASTLTVMEFQDLWPHLSLVIDGGPVGDSHRPDCRLGSTVVDLSKPGKFKVIRPGCALTQTIEILVTKHGLSSELPSL
uniref:Threonylcarbamoyl-AMP synthase n=2 Tax=Varanus komodoensis TaxID=61221 RepID=A0A8D2Q1S2_VARKO